MKVFLKSYPVPYFRLNNIINRVQHLQKGLHSGFNLPYRYNIVYLQEQGGDPNILKGLNNVMIIKAMGITELLQ